MLQTTSHNLSNISDTKRMAICSTCGPVHIYVVRRQDGSIMSRRCSKANSANTMAARAERRQTNREFIDEYKVERGCARCGYKEHAFALDLHHRNPAEKDLKISRANSYSREKLLRELSKCDVLCAICHRVVHRELGWIN